MEPLFKRTYQINDIHVDCFGRAKPSVLLFFAQEAAGAHCTQLAVDHSVLEKRNLFWAIIRNRTEIVRLPRLGETVTVETWPMPTTRSSFPRSTVAYDEKGNLLFRSISLWVLMDINQRTMVLPGKSGIALTGTLRGNELAAPSSIAPKALENSVCRTVGYTELDRNGHMNNTRYLDWLDDLLPSLFHKEHPVQAFTVCYLSEAREGETIVLNYQLSDGPCLQVEGCRKGVGNEEKPERVFTAQVYF